MGDASEININFKISKYLLNFELISILEKLEKTGTS
jgi:hypothetical protein